MYKSEQVSNVPIGPDYHIQGGGAQVDIYNSLAMCKKNTFTSHMGLEFGVGGWMSISCALIFVNFSRKFSLPDFSTITLKQSLSTINGSPSKTGLLIDASVEMVKVSGQIHVTSARYLRTDLMQFGSFPSHNVNTRLEIARLL